MEPFIGQLMLVGFNFAPQGWALCNGQLLSIAENSALFSLLGTTYGGNGTTTFALPDLRGRTALHFGQGPGLSNYVQGQASGSESVTLLVSNLPAHTHSLAANSGAGVSSDPTGKVLAAFRDDENGSGPYASAANTMMSPQAIGPTGGSQPVSIMQPYLVLNWIIALEGIYPSRG